MASNTYIGTGAGGIGLIEQRNGHMIIGHYDSKGFFVGFQSSLKPYTHLKACRVVSLANIKANKVGVDLYENYESTFLESASMNQAMAAAKREKPDVTLFRIGKIDCQTFTQVVYVFYI